jgi:hypothetical protein
MLKSKGIWQPLILATVLTVGFVVAWGIASGWMVSIYQNNRTEGHWQRLRFRLDGTPLIQQARGYRDLAGNDVETTDKDLFVIESFLSAGLGESKYPLPTPWSERTRGFIDTGRPPGLWYFISDGRSDGSAYMVGYDQESNARIGFLGKAGFRMEELPLEERLPFDGSASGIHLRIECSQSGYRWNPKYYTLPRVADADEIPPWMVFLQGNDDKLYQIDLSRRTVNVALVGAKIQSAALIYNPGATQAKRIGLALRTEDAILVLNNRNEISATFPLPPELRGKTIYWGETNAGTTVAWTTDYHSLQGSRKSEVYWQDSTGRVIRHEEITLPGQDSSIMRFFMGVIVPAPVLASSFVVLYTSFSPENPEASWSEAWAQCLDYFWPFLLVALLVGTVFAGLCYRREARYGASTKERILWTIFVFAFGIGGWIGYRFGRSWPALATCPTCGAVVPRDRIACAACQAEFPLPALKGTEVFA